MSPLTHTLTFARLIRLHLECRSAAAIRVGRALTALGFALARLQRQTRIGEHILLKRSPFAGGIYLDRVLLHCERPPDAMQLVVQAARVAHGLTFVGATPQGRLRRMAIGAGEADAS